MRYPPYQTDPFTDIWDNSVSDTIESIKQDLPDIIREAVMEFIEQYYEIPSQWRDEVLDNEADFQQEVIDELIKQIKIK